MFSNINVWRKLAFAGFSRPYFTFFLTWVTSQEAFSSKIGEVRHLRPIAHGRYRDRLHQLDRKDHTSYVWVRRIVQLVVKFKRLFYDQFQSLATEIFIKFVLLTIDFTCARYQTNSMEDFLRPVP